MAVAEPGPDILAAKAEQGTDDAFAGRRTDSAQTGGSRAAQKAGEDGFSLIVEGMAGCDSVAFSGRDRFEEERVTRATGFLFEIAFGDRAGCDVDWKSKALGEFGYEGFVGIGIGGTEFVVDVEHGGGETGFVERAEQEDGIGAAGNGYTDAPAAGKHGMALDGSGDCVVQVQCFHPTLFYSTHGVDQAFTLDTLECCHD